MPNDVHGKLMALMRGLTMQYMEIGALLTEIQEYEIWKDKRYKVGSFSEYLDQYVGVAYSTARKWMKISRTFGDLEYPAGLTLGPTKMSLLCGLVDQSNVKEMLIWAAKASGADILRRRHAGRNRVVSFWLTDAQADRAESYISEAMAAGAETKGEAAAFLLDTAMGQLEA